MSIICLKRSFKDENENGGVTLTEEESQQFLYQIEHPDLEQLDKLNNLLELGRSIMNNDNRIVIDNFLEDL